MNFKNIENFYWVAQLNSFNKAATQLKTSQPAVSQRLNALEKELGVKLLDRTSRSIQLTDQGKVVFDYAAKYIQLNNQLMRSLSEKTAFNSCIRLGVAETVVHTWLVEFIERVSEEFPRVTIDIVINLTPMLKEAVRSGELDMAFLLDAACDFDCVSVPLCSFEHSFLIAPRLKKRFSQRCLDLKDLTQHTILTYPKNTYPYKDLKNQMVQQYLNEPKMITSYSLSTLIKMTEDGLGIGIIPHLSVLNELKAQRLAILNTALHLKPFDFSCVYILGKDDFLKQQLTEIAIEISKYAVKKLNLDFLRYQQDQEQQRVI